MKNQNKTHPHRLDRLRRDIREGPERGQPVHWDIGEMKRHGRKRLAARKATK